MREYYEDERISQSYLKRFLNPNPRSLHRSKIEDELYYVKEKIHFSKGKLLDILLEDGDINDYFYIQEEGYKHPSAKVLSIIQEIIDSTDANTIYNFELVNEIRLAQGYQIRWKEEKAKEWYNEILPLIEFKDQARGLVIITYEEFEQIATIAKSIKEGEYTKPILEEFSGEYQKELYTDKHKALIDFFQIDHEKKVMRIIDFKTTGDYLEKFKKSILKFRYDIQLDYYGWIAKANYPEYELLDPVLIVCSTKEPHFAEPFTLNKEVCYNAAHGFFDRYNNYYKGWLELLRLSNEYAGQMYNRELITNKTNNITADDF